MSIPTLRFCFFLYLHHHATLFPSQYQLSRHAFSHPSTHSSHQLFPPTLYPLHVPPIPFIDLSFVSLLPILSTFFSPLPHFSVNFLFNSCYSLLSLAIPYGIVRVPEGRSRVPSLGRRRRVRCHGNIWCSSSSLPSGSSWNDHLPCTTTLAPQGGSTRRERCSGREAEVIRVEDVSREDYGLTNERRDFSVLESFYLTPS